MKATLLKQIESWHKSIALHLLQQRPEDFPSELIATTQQLVLAVLWLILCEQRGVVTSARFAESDRLYSQILQQLHQLSCRFEQSLPFVLPDHLPGCDYLLHDFIQKLHSAATTAMLPSYLLGQAYEQSLSWSVSQDNQGQIRLKTNSNRRKASGIYYTPEAIVSYVVQQTVDLRLQTLSTAVIPAPTNLRILDLACGGGAFLLAAYQRLLEFYEQTNNADRQIQLTLADRSHILQNHIYGVDLDPQAVAITQLSLWLKLLEVPQLQLQPLPDLSRNIRCGDAVMNHGSGFDWEREFSEILSAGGFDVVIGNPPYLDSEGMAVHLPQCRQYCNQHYRSATGNWDLFCVFIEKAIDLCRTGGLVSLVVPNKLSSADYARATRLMLSQENQLLSLRDYVQVPVFAASVYPLVFVGQKRAAEPNAANRLPTQYELMRDLNQVQHSQSIDLHSLPEQQGWQFATNPQQSRLIARLQQEFPTLDKISTVRGAATVAEAYRLSALMQDNSTIAPGDLQVVNSGTIDRYRFLWGEKPLRYLGQSYLYPCIPADQTIALPAKRYQQAQQPKIIVAGMTQRLECAFDAVGAILAAKSTSIIWVNGDAIDLRYLLGLLNSQLLSFYFSHAFNGNRLQGGYFRVGPPQLRSLPIALPNLNCADDCKHYQQIIECVEQRLTGQLQLDVAIDRWVCQLYRLTDSECQELTALASHDSLVQKGKTRLK